MPDVFLDGEFINAGDARVSAFDAGLQHGVGLFESFLGGAGAPPGEDRDAPDVTTAEGLDAWAWGLRAHVARLIGSARALGLSESLRSGPMIEAALRTIARSGHARARVRITVTGGDLNLLHRGEAKGVRHEPTVMIAVTPRTEYPPAMFERGVTATIADWKANPLDPMQGHKTTAYWGRLRELQVAAAKGAAEAVVLTVTNHLCGGCVSNVFLARDGRLLTPIARGEEGDGDGGPALPSPVLPGITRGWVIEWAADAGLEVEKRMLSVADMLDADEVFLTNSSWGVLPVVKVESAAVGGARSGGGGGSGGEVGPMTRRVMKAYAAAMGVGGGERAWE